MFISPSTNDSGHVMGESWLLAGNEKPTKIWCNQKWTLTISNERLNLTILGLDMISYLCPISQGTFNNSLYYSSRLRNYISLTGV